MESLSDTKPEFETLDLVWGADEIGRIIKRSPRQVRYLVDTGELPGAFKKGKRLCISRRDLIAAFETTVAAAVKP